ncbi:8322_t:CDS:2, partial [Funneliformis geosporum]
VLRKRPVTGLDFASLCPSLIITYNLFPEKFILSSKDADIARKIGNTLHKIKDLFNKRVEFKIRLALLGKKKEQLEKLISSAKERGKRIPEREAGNSKSPIFLRELAERITSTGKYNLNLVTEF